MEKNFLRLISFFPEVCFLMILFLFIFSCAGSSLPPGHFLIAESGDSSLADVHRLLIVRASLAVEHRLWGSVVVAHGLSCA